jgi:hypothetical protein
MREQVFFETVNRVRDHLFDTGTPHNAGGATAQSAEA